MPIEYIENKVSLEANIVDDLELLNTKDASATPIYDIVFSPEHVFSKETIKLWAKYYTSDKNFLDDSKKLIKNLNPLKIIQAKWLKFSKINSNLMKLMYFFKDREELSCKRSMRMEKMMAANISKKRVS